MAGRRAARTAAAEPGEVGEQQPRLVDGIKVVKDEPELSPLSRPSASITFRGRRVLTLEDGSQVHGCADCLYVGSRGDVIKHRMDKHGAAKSSGGARVKDAGPPENVLRMTLGEVLRLAGNLDAWEELVTALEQRATTAEAERDAARTELRRIKRALERAGFAPKVDEED